MNLTQIIKGDYVFTPIKNAFNSKTAYWISKKGYAVALYAFTVYGEKDLREMTTDESLDSYIRYFRDRVENTKNQSKGEKKMNTKFDFLYRDASNFKKHNTIICEGQISEEETRDIYDSLDLGEYFIPEQVGIEAERFGAATEDDHCWCEIGEDAFTSTDEEPTTTLSAKKLVEAFREAKGNWDDVKYAIVG